MPSLVEDASSYTKITNYSFISVLKHDHYYNYPFILTINTRDFIRTKNQANEQLLEIQILFCLKFIDDLYGLHGKKNHVLYVFSLKKL